jgi:uncharacterized membrane protein (GlpM family)
MNRPLFPTTLSIPSYDMGKKVKLRTYQRPLVACINDHQKYSTVCYLNAEWIICNKLDLPPVIAVDIWMGMLFDIRVSWLTHGWPWVHYRVVLSSQSCDPTTRLIFYAFGQSIIADNNELVFLQTSGIAMFVTSSAHNLEWLFIREIMNLKVTVIYSLHFDLDQ